MIISLSSKIVKKEKPVKVPKSIAFAAEKTKSRIVKAVPGRYILKNRKGMFVIVRFKEETRYTASVGTKLFSASSTENDVEDYFVVESESNQPGARNSSVGNKLGKKNHAKGMMAPGWWLFAKRADGKMQKAYIGGRISGRRLLGLLDPAPVAKEEPKKPKTIKPISDTIPERKKPVSGKLKDKKPVRSKILPPATTVEELRARHTGDPAKDAKEALRFRVAKLQAEEKERNRKNDEFSTKKAPELKNFGTDMRTLVDAVLVARHTKDPEVADKYAKDIGEKAHEAWAAQFRKDNPDQKSRVKATKDADWIKANGTDKVDILNTKFKDLPSDWQAENLKGAHASIEAFRKAAALISKDPKADLRVPLEKASAEVHKKWLERNGAWAQEDQKVDYKKLSETEKQKDRDFIANTIKVLAYYR